MIDVSVVIPMKNAEPYVRETLEAVLAQSGMALEVIVIDDGSTDRSREIAEQMRDSRVHIIDGPRRGISAAFNAGLTAARGDVLARCDADDLYPPGRLAWQVQFLREHPEFGAVCGSFATISPKGKMIAWPSGGAAGEEITAELLAGGGRSHMCAYAFRTALLREIGGCREWFVTSEDRDLQFRLAEITRIRYEPRLAYLYRLHDASVTHTQQSRRRRFFEQMSLEFQRQRREVGMDDLQREQAPPPPDSDDSKPRSTRQQIQELLLGESWKMHATGNKLKSLGIGLRACAARPCNLTAWKSFAALIVKPTNRQSAIGNRQ
jgi:glycosyltransferase involved in cell wall biosynthesis